MPLHLFETRLACLWPPEQWLDLTVLLAVSGGADSVALLRAMAALKTGGLGRLCVAHFNHKLRDQADDDQHFVVSLCKQLGLSCETGCCDVAQLAAGTGEGIEPAARRARYDFLKDTAGRLGARFVLTAHTADDQAETILHRIVRGTGISGLAGMSRSRRLGHATLLRPLLGVRRRELEAYLHVIGQPFREDPSNADRRFTRNRIRHGLLPLLARQYNSAVSDALLRLGSLAADVQAVIDGLVDQLYERAVKFENSNSVEINAALLAGQAPYLLRELLVCVWRRQSWPMRAMGFTQWDQLARLLAETDRSSPAVVSKQIFPGNVQAEIRHGKLRLLRVE
ncbi:MAG: tRNA lysidine(34) synthetase TilS [Thermoguttaceae bacterium]|jgi:tRNA(Ile)-lysidine synthase